MLTVSNRLLSKLFQLCEFLAMGSIFLIALLIGSQIILRIFGLQIPSVIEISSFLLAGSVFLALPNSFLRDRHLRITVLIQLLPKRLERVVNLFCHFLCLVMLITISYESVLFSYESFYYKEVSDGIVGVPLWMPQSFMALGLIAMSLAVLQKFIEIIWER